MGEFSTKKEWLNGKFGGAIGLGLLEQLNVACGYFITNNITLPNSETLYSLFQKSKALLNEIQADEPKTLQYTSLADEKKHPFRTDEEVPVP